jgi:hypothetical protein
MGRSVNEGKGETARRHFDSSTHSWERRASCSARRGSGWEGGGAARCWRRETTPWVGR